MSTMVYKYVYKWRRLLKRRPRKHTASAHPRFDLRDIGSSGPSKSILWRGKVVGETLPLSELKNSAVGPCMVICTGPSLEQVDIAQANGMPCIGVNGAIDWLLDQGVSPDYYTITDPDFFDARFEMVRRVIESGARCFFSFTGLSRICQREPELLRQANVYLLDVANHRYDHDRIPPHAFSLLAQSDPDFELHPHGLFDDDLIGFSRNLEKGVFCGQTIAFRAIEVAYYIGFEKLHLLGMDLGPSGNRIRYYESVEGGRRSLLAQDFDSTILPCFEIVAQLCLQDNFEVINHSLQSRLPHEVIPKMAFNKVKNKRPAA